MFNLIPVTTGNIMFVSALCILFGIVGYTCLSQADSDSTASKVLKAICIIAIAYPFTAVAGFMIRSLLSITLG